MGTNKRSAEVTSIQQVAQFRLVLSQLSSLLDEIRELSKKKPNDPVNEFKLGFVNEKLDEANAILGSAGKPLRTFDRFDQFKLNSNSDVVLILSQYKDALYRWKTAHVFQNDIFKSMWNTEPPIEA